jgi:ParB/RepB/Spo0J family partition protein
MRNSTWQLNNPINQYNMSEVKKRDLPMVPYQNLVIRPGLNIRTDMGDLQQLSDSIKENGLRVPLRGYKEKGTEKYIVTNGHRRHAAIGLFINEINETYYVPIVLEPQKYSDELRIIDMFIMNDGKNLTPLEQAEGVRRLQQCGYNDKEIATKISRSPAYVCKLSSLNTAPKKLINLIAKDTIAASFAMDIIAKGEVDKFLADFEAGAYSKTSNGLEMFPDQEPKNGKTKITKGDVQTVNSWKEFKRFAKEADEKKMEDEKAKFFKFLCRVMNNDVSEDQIKRFFK